MSTQRTRAGAPANLTFDALVAAICAVDGQLAAQAGRAVNIALTLRNWIIGCHIAEYELKGADRARYGARLFSRLAARLATGGVARCEERQLRRYRQFYTIYPRIGESLTPEMRPTLPARTATAVRTRESATPKLPTRQALRHPAAWSRKRSQRSRRPSRRPPQEDGI